jgi:hypothetical protein
MRISHICVVSEQNITDDHRACLLAALQRLFPGFNEVQAGHIDWHIPFPYGTYGEDNVLKFKERFKDMLVVYLGRTEVPPREAAAVRQAGGYPVAGYFFAEVTGRKQLSLSAYNLRYTSRLHCDHDKKWLASGITAGDIYGEWPPLEFVLSAAA